MSEINAMTAAASSISQERVASDVAMKVAVKAQNVTKQQGEAVVSMLESALEVQQLSLARAKAGGGLDVTA